MFTISSGYCGSTLQPHCPREADAVDKVSCRVREARRLNMNLFHQFVWELGNIPLISVFVGASNRLTSCRLANILANTLSLYSLAVKKLLFLCSVAHLIIECVSKATSLIVKKTLPPFNFCTSVFSSIMFQPCVLLAACQPLESIMGKRC